MLYFVYRLKTVTADNKTIVNGYNGEGYRTSKSVDGVVTNYLYEYDKVVLETDGDNVQKARNVYGTNLISRNVDNQIAYYLYNGHADVVALVDGSGNTLTTYYYDAFGNIVEQTGTIDNNITYAGYQYDKETGKYYLNARMYDPVTARFMQEDTYRGDKNDPLSLNLYTYCHNEPLMYTDPTGHEQIVVSGSEYNIPIVSPRYKYNFIEPAIKKLKELKSDNKDESITWLISSTGYSKTDIKNFTNTSKKIGVNIKFFANKDEFIGYINTKNKNNNERDNDKITKIAFFSHGTPGVLAFGYNQFNENNIDINTEDVQTKIRDKAFNNPNSWFGSCNAGTPQGGDLYSMQKYG